MEFNAQLSQRPQTFYLGSFQLLRLLPTVQKHALEVNLKLEVKLRVQAVVINQQIVQVASAF